MAAENTAENTMEETGKRRRRARAEEAAVVEEAPEASSKGRVTPGRRNQEEEETGGNVITSPLIRFREYLKDVRSELSKVVWPTREETTRLARIVLVTLILSAVVMGVIGFLIGRFVTFGLNNVAVLVIGAGIVVGGTLYYFRRENTGRRGY